MNIFLADLGPRRAVINRFHFLDKMRICVKSYETHLRRVADAVSGKE